MWKKALKNVILFGVSFLIMFASVAAPAVTVSAHEDYPYYSVSVSTNHVNMGTLLPETMDSHQSFTVTNTGNVQMNLGLVVDDPASAFIVEVVSGYDLAPGQSTTVEIWQKQFLPAGSYSGSISFYDMDDGEILAEVGMSMTVEEPPSEVYSVEISPDGASVSAGSSCAFSASVYGQNLITDGVTWSISGNQSPSTAINSSGTLTVAADESAGSINVTAVSNQDPNVRSTVQVNVSRPAFTVKASANPSEGGSVSGEATVNYGGRVTLTAKANNGYSFDGFYEGNSKISSSPSLELNGITSNRNITAVFVRSGYTVKAYANPEKTGTVSGAGSFNKGSKVTLKATPANGYVFSGWTRDGKTISTDPTYQIGSLDADITLVANFTRKEAVTYTIKASVSGEGGSISPSGEQKIPEGASTSFTITPNSGYKISKVIVDGKNVGAVPSYTFSGVKGAHTISASFAKETQTKTDNTKTDKTKTDKTKTQKEGSLADQKEKEDADKDTDEVEAEQEPEIAEPEPEETKAEAAGIMGKHNLNEASLRAVIEDHDSAIVLIKEAYDEGYLRVSLSSSYASAGQPEILNAQEMAMESLTKEETYNLLSGNAIAYNVSITGTDNTVNEDAKSMFQRQMGYKPVGYFDVSVLKISSMTTESVINTGAPLIVKLPIPASYQKEGREFYVMRYHDGEVTILENIGGDEGYVTFATDRFSDYALCYKERSLGNVLYIVFIVAGIALITAIILTVKRILARY